MRSRQQPNSRYRRAAVTTTFLTEADYHVNFTQRLVKSQSGVDIVADFYRRNDRDVIVSPLRVAPFGANPLDFVDKCDLLLDGKYAVEVKQLRPNFKCRRDWINQFGNKMLVCNVAAWKRADPKPVAFWFLSADGTHGACLLTVTHPAWKSTQVRDSNRGDLYKAYMCAPAMAYFVQVQDET
jgi:hypothetical protein